MDDVVDRVHHVIGSEWVAVLEGNALAQGKIDGGGVDLGPGGGKIGLDLRRRRITIDKAIIGKKSQNHAGAQRVVIGIDIRDRITPSDPQRVLRLLRQRRRYDCTARTRRQQS